MQLAAGGDSDNGLEDEDGSEANAKDATRVADYRQGKRYKQLVSLLSSKPAKVGWGRWGCKQAGLALFGRAIANATSAGVAA